MLPRRFHLHPGEPLDAPDQTSGLLTQASVALLAILVLALVAAFTTEALSLLAPSDALAFAP